MIGYLLDTDHFSLLERSQAVFASNLTRHRPEEVAISIVTVEESLRGRLAVIARASTDAERLKGYREFHESVDLIGRLQILSYDEAAEKIFRSFRDAKLRVGTQDLKIASVALASSCVLVTRNRRDFARVPGMAIEDWSGG